MCGKVKHKDIASAICHANGLKLTNGGGKYGCYYCKECKSYHVTHKARRVTKIIEIII